MILYDTMYIMNTNEGASGKGKWTTIRVSVDLYERLKQRKEETQLPIATMVRLAVEHYLDERTQISSFLKQLKENMDLVDQVREILKKE